MGGEAELEARAAVADCQPMAVAQLLLLGAAASPSYSAILSSRTPPVAAVAAVPLPTAAQLRYQRNEISALIHFNMGTFACTPGTGYDGCRDCWLATATTAGNSAPNVSRDCANVAGPGRLARTFNPTKLSTDNWAESIVALGAKAAVLTAKHDSGHLLWPTNVTLPDGTEYTYAVGHSESAIQVDVLRQFTESMQQHGLGHGFYYSVGNNVYLNVKIWAISMEGCLQRNLDNIEPEKIVQLHVCENGSAVYADAQALAAMNAAIPVTDSIHNWAAEILDSSRPYLPFCIVQR